ncbi:MAG: glycine cleavage system protein H [Phycisphaerales bacterium JB039]
MYVQTPLISKCREALLASALVVAAMLCLPLIGVAMFVLRPLLGPIAIALVVGAGLYCLAEPRVRQRQLRTRIVPKVRSYRGIRLARDVALDRGHCWAWADGDVVVGADDLVQAALGPIDHVGLPAEGERIARGEPLCLLEHQDRSIALPSPVSGVVIGVNPALREHPELINTSPFTEGWVALIHADRMAEERPELLVGHRAWRWMRGQVDALLARLPVRDGAESLDRRIDRPMWDALRPVLAGQRSWRDAFWSA